MLKHEPIQPITPPDLPKQNVLLDEVKEIRHEPPQPFAPPDEPTVKDELIKPIVQSNEALPQILAKKK